LTKFQQLVENLLFPLVTDDVKPQYREATSSVSLQLEEWLDGPAYAGELAQIFNRVDEHGRTEMSRVMGIDFKGSGFEAQRRTWVKSNVKLIKSVSFEKLEAMREMVEASVTGQSRVENLRGALMAQFDLTKARASLIARDQTLKLNSQLAQARATSIGVRTYTWVTSRDERVRGRPGGKWANSAANHWALDGKVFSYADPPVTNPRTGERNHPGQDYQCRCIAVPNTDELLGLDE
jgi:SPP1 gp7 family putative phage head morphogenesis protein